MPEGTSRPGKSPLIWVIVAFAIVILVGVNMMSFKSTPKSDEEEAAEKAAAAASASPAASATPPAPGQPGQGGADALVTTGPFKLMGKVDSDKEIILGYKWTPEVQADPSRVYNAVQMLQQALPDVRLRLVNTDQVPSLPDGVSVGGHVLIPPAPDGSITVPGQVLGAIQMAMRAPVGALPPNGLPKVVGAPASPSGAPGGASAKH